MNELIKKTLLFGIGSVYYTRERFEEFIEELKSEEKITPEEGKKLVEDLISKTQEFRDTQVNQLKKVMKDIVSEMGLATKTDLEDLVSRLNKDSK